MAGMVLVETLFWIPVVFLLMAVPLRSMDPSLEEAGAMSGAAPPRVLWSITLRLALPGDPLRPAAYRRALDPGLRDPGAARRASGHPRAHDGGLPGGARVARAPLRHGERLRRPDARPRPRRRSTSTAASTRDAHRFATITGQGLPSAAARARALAAAGRALIFFVVAVQFLPLAGPGRRVALALDQRRRTFWNSLTLEHYAPCWQPDAAGQLPQQPAVGLPQRHGRRDPQRAA